MKCLPFVRRIPWRKKELSSQVHKENEAWRCELRRGGAARRNGVVRGGGEAARRGGVAGRGRVARRGGGVRQSVEAWRGGVWDVPWVKS